ncbi:hypothetical protein JRO89_XS09G0050000 [Xanthoceras sorbifolium]|uniref:DUF4219 domain-containing protein n=1 Tax=Xanthoceras sorbifolium TaxID=99658 RepID=A0ABQ8HKI6_9ROSI|nr:hypothetical protein JRO89_XS09G0050000 [Xanthoceras sorbifolium]
MANGNAHIVIPTCIKDNYDNWCIKMIALLGSQDVMDIVEDGYIEPASKEAEGTLTEAQTITLKANRKKNFTRRSDDRVLEQALQSKLSLNEKRYEQGGTSRQGRERGRGSREKGSGNAETRSRGRGGKDVNRGGCGQQNYVS